MERCEKIDLADLKRHGDTFAEGEAVALGSALVSLRYPGLRLREVAATFAAFDKSNFRRAYAADFTTF